MTLDEIFKDKTIKPKERTETIAKWMLKGALPVDELLAYASKAKDPVKATCIGAAEFATKGNAEIADEDLLAFVTKELGAKAPRIKWESAKVIGNTAHLFPARLQKPIDGLLLNTKHEGTVVRWSAAFALGEILKLKLKYNKSLLPEIEKVMAKEEKNSIKKIYAAAIKKLNSK